MDLYVYLTGAIAGLNALQARSIPTFVLHLLIFIWAIGLVVSGAV